MTVKTISGGRNILVHYVPILASYKNRKTTEKKAGIVAYLFADAIANDKFPRYANKPYKDQINTLTTVPCVQTSILYLS